MSSKIILLLGPSGVGKSTTSKILNKKYFIPVYNTDKMIRNSRGGRISVLPQKVLFEEAKVAIEGLYDENKICLIDVGAGSIDFNISWYKNFYRICLLNDDVSTLQKRREKHHNSLDSYKRVELSEERKDLYESSHYKINTTSLTKSAVAKEVHDCIIRIIDL